MPNVLRMTGWVLGGFLIFDLVGVALTLVVDMAVTLNRVWEGSSPLAYVIWFVVGVFCAAFIYICAIGDGYESSAGRRAGTRLAVITAVVAGVLGILASFVWSDSGAGEALAPDHRGVTITYLVTVVLFVALARGVLFRDGAGAGGELAAPAPESAPSPPKWKASRPVATPSFSPTQEEDGWDNPAAFKPAGFWKTVGFLVGVPALLFLDASVFPLDAFDYFDRWTDPILTLSLIGGLAWGFAAARWWSPRTALLALHAPLICGTIVYLFAVLASAVLVTAGVSERVAGIVSSVGFWAGFVLGFGAIIGWCATHFERGNSKKRGDRT